MVPCNQTSGHVQHLKNFATRSDEMSISGLKTLQNIKNRIVVDDFFIFFRLREHCGLK